MLTHEVEFLQAQAQRRRSKNRPRLQLEFSPEAYERLLAIRKESASKTNAEVVRHALHLLDWLMERRNAGYDVQLSNPESGKLTSVEFDFLPDVIRGKKTETKGDEVGTENRERKESEPQPPSKLDLELIDPALFRALLDHPELLRTLHWRTFEKLLADVLSSFGYEIELCRGTKDGGIDIFALKRVDLMGPHLYILQAKRWSDSVGIEPVRQLMFLHSDLKATKSCLATTSRFTSGAWELSHRYRWQLELRDFEIQRAYNIKLHLQ